MTPTCGRCGDEIAFGQPFHMIQDESGGATYAHLTRASGGLETFLHACPQPIPAVESGHEEVPMPATNGGLASPQVNSGSALDDCLPRPDPRTERGGAAPIVSEGAPLPRRTAASSFALDELRDALATAIRNDTDVLLEIEVVQAVLDELEFERSRTRGDRP